MILALDLATLTGYAVGGDGFPPRGGTINLKPAKGETDAVRFLRLTQHLKRIIKEHEITEIYFEKVDFIVSTRQGHLWGGYWSYLLGVAHANKLTCTGINVKKLKKYATGNGNAKKEQMIQAAIAKGWRPQDDNEADALWILDYAINVIKKGN